MLLQLTQSAQTCAQLIEQFEYELGKEDAVPARGETLRFAGVGGRDVYNIAAPFEDEGETVLAGRVEGRDTELSQVMFFRRGADNVWHPRPGLPIYELQDPFFTRIKGELVFGGVEVILDPDYPGEIISWVTRLYRGPSVAELRPFFTGPGRMKDLRVVELASGRIGVLTRPQGLKGGRGKIGFFQVDDLEHLTEEAVAEAPVFEDQFVREEWGGANEPRLLANGLIGVLGHIASFDERGDRHYYAMTFAIDPQTGWKSAMKLIARRACFPPGPAKRPDLADVIFSGGLIRREGGLADLYVGGSDAEACRLTIADPFLEYEAL